jgi:transglutaminase-like putative cysteine protease
MPLYEFIPANWQGTERTVHHMRDLAVKAAKDWGFIRIATPFALGVPRDFAAQGQRIIDWVKKHIEYVPDPVTAADKDGVPQGMELVQAPLRTIQRGAGDCDDHSTLIASMGMVLGIPAEFATVKADPRRPKEFSHIYPRLLIDGDWRGADSTVARSFLGREPERHWGKSTWRI